MISSRTLVRSSIRATAAWPTSLSICWPHWSPTLIRRRNLLSIFILMTWRLCQRLFFNLSYIELTLSGEMEHKDSRGHAGSLRAGAVQWMTAGAGVVHAERPSAEFQRTGGRLPGFPLWWYLSKRDKRSSPLYHAIPA